MQKTTFCELKQGKPSFPGEETKIIEYWRKIKPFDKQLQKSSNKKPFVFYDGPPFATGKPHYGHILAGTIKDVICRYKTQTDHFVQRRFGWDCHGVPVEHLVEKDLKIKTREQVINMGIKRYNEECRNVVMKCVDDWKSTVERMGRWIDFDNGYKTMDKSYMESVWWVFSQIHKKGLLYKGVKVLPYSTGLNTALSNFEANLNYKENHPVTAITVSFPIVNDEDNTSFLAWTTTPWTLPSNLALCVNASLRYVKFKDEKRKNYIACKNLLRFHNHNPTVLCNGYLRTIDPNNLLIRHVIVIKSYFSECSGKCSQLLLKSVRTVKETSGGDKTQKYNKGKNSKNKALLLGVNEIFELIANYMDYRARIMDLIDSFCLKYAVLEEYNGKELVGKKYEPLFDYFSDRKHCFRVVSDDYVTKDTGTGIVHQAPGFGEDDLRVSQNNGIYKRGKEDIICPVDHNGRFTSEVKHYAGQYVLDANKNIIKDLRKAQRLWKVENFRHNYPFCWRSDTPLLYKATPSWFIRVSDLRKQLKNNNNQIKWVPGKVKNRFSKWLEEACDWSVSRDRYWGTPIPIWISDDEKEWEVIANVDELQQRTGQQINDLHRENIDKLTVKSLKTGKTLKRIEAVFDCWFESGSMPYGQCNYPYSFKNKSEFHDNRFPADFIAEGLDQTRGWFYTLLVLSTALFDQPSFKNVIVNGILLNEKGEKMSKSKRNYPEPVLILDKYGADALRIYLCQSRAVHGDDVKFLQSGVANIVSVVLSRWYNAYNFFIQNATRFERNHKILFTDNKNIYTQVDNIMDRWILSELQSLIKFVRNGMNDYKLFTFAPKLIIFIDLLCNTYVKLNNSRLRGLTSKEDTKVSLQVLYNVLLSLCRLMSPLSPFIVETMYLNLRNALDENEREESVHFLSIPTVYEQAIDKVIERQIGNLMEVVKIGRNIRDKNHLRSSQPLAEMVVYHQNKQFLKDIETLKEYVMKELNVKQVSFTNEVSDYIRLGAQPEYKSLGPKFQQKTGKLCAAIRKLTHGELVLFLENGELELLGETLTKNDIDITWNFSGDRNKWVCNTDETMNDNGNKKGKKQNKNKKHAQKREKKTNKSEVLVLIDKRITKELLNEAVARAICNNIQQLKKNNGLVPGDEVVAFYRVLVESEEKKGGELSQVFEECNGLIEKYTTTKCIPLRFKSKYVGIVGEDIAIINNSKVQIVLSACDVYLNPKSETLNKLNENQRENIEIYLQCQNVSLLKQKYPKNSMFQFCVDDKEYKLIVGHDFGYHPFVL